VGEGCDKPDRGGTEEEEDELWYWLQMLLWIVVVAVAWADVFDGRSNVSHTGSTNIWSNPVAPICIGVKDIKKTTLLDIRTDSLKRLRAVQWWIPKGETLDSDKMKDEFPSDTHEHTVVVLQGSVNLNYDKKSSDVEAGGLMFFPISDTYFTLTSMEKVLSSPPKGLVLARMVPTGDFSCTVVISIMYEVLPRPTALMQTSKYEYRTKPFVSPSPHTLKWWSKMSPKAYSHLFEEGTPGLSRTHHFNLAFSDGNKLDPHDDPDYDALCIFLTGEYVLLPEGEVMRPGSLFISPLGSIHGFKSTCSREDGLIGGIMIVMELER